LRSNISLVPQGTNFIEKEKTRFRVSFLFLSFVSEKELGKNLIFFYIPIPSIETPLPYILKNTYFTN